MFNEEDNRRKRGEIILSSISLPTETKWEGSLNKKKKLVVSIF